MAIIKNGLSMMMRGKVGAFSYYVSETRQIVRQAQNNSNFGATATRSPQQQSRRVLWANLVNFYSGNKGWMKKAFEDLKPGVSVFNRFMQLNIPNAHVALTKDQARSKMWVVAPYVVSQGSLPSPSFSTWSEEYESMVTFAESPAADATVAQVSSAILQNNANFLNGDAIIAINFGGTGGTPSQAGDTRYMATFIYQEFVLNTSDSRKFSEAYPAWKISENKFLRNLYLDGASAYTYIHTRNRDGKLLVSTSKMVMSPTSIQNSEAWGDSTQMTKATESYNVETPVLLLPGGAITGNSGTAGGGSNPDGGDDDDDGNLGE